MEKNKTIADYVKLAKHYKAIGSTEIYLYDVPTELLSQVCSVTDGGSYRHGVPVSVTMKIRHRSGLSFRFSVDFESREANGSAHIQIDGHKLRGIYESLPSSAKKQFLDALEAPIQKAREQADEYRRAAFVIEQQIMAINVSLKQESPCP